MPEVTALFSAEEKREFSKFLQEAADSLHLSVTDFLEDLGLDARAYDRIRFGVKSARITRRSADTLLRTLQRRLTLRGLPGHDQKCRVLRTKVRRCFSRSPLSRADFSAVVLTAIDMFADVDGTQRVELQWSRTDGSAYAADWFVHKPEGVFRLVFKADARRYDVFITLYKDNANAGPLLTGLLGQSTLTAARAIICRRDPSRTAQPAFERYAGQILALVGRKISRS